MSFGGPVCLGRGRILSGSTPDSAVCALKDRLFAPWNEPLDTERVEPAAIHSTCVGIGNALYGAAPAQLPAHLPNTVVVKEGHCSSTPESARNSTRTPCRAT